MRSEWSGVALQEGEGGKVALGVRKKRRRGAAEGNQWRLWERDEV